MQPDGQPLPGVSYVMPVLNEVTEVRAAVQSLLDQEGRVAARILGQLQDASILETIVDGLLAEGA